MSQIHLPSVHFLLNPLQSKGWNEQSWDISPRIHDRISIASLTSDPESPPSRSPGFYELSKVDKPKRRKRECPQCHKLFSNLATHKSTHLASDLKPHVCTTCSRGFARPNDLVRHEKSHLKEMNQTGFVCPFHLMDDVCHTTGVFSRCDTYKNHLRALHFQYPAGTKKRDRGLVAGNCKSCGASFANVDDWLSNHVETRKCEFVAKST